MTRGDWWPSALLRRPAGADSRSDEAPAYDLIELFFFAYRDFVADPDRLLQQYGFGRAPHRVLHFVARRPVSPSRTCWIS
jgi:hypothetical protein